MAKSAKPAPASDAEAKARARVKPRHELFNWKPGLPGYRKGCKCDTCRGAKAAYQREQRAKRKRAQLATEPAAEAPSPDDSREWIAQFESLLDLPAGAVSQALEGDLKKADGAYVFGDTVATMARISARMLDNAVPLGNLDYVSKMQIRLLDALKRLEPPRGGQDQASKQIDEMLRSLREPTASES